MELSSLGISNIEVSIPQHAKFENVQISCFLYWAYVNEGICLHYGRQIYKISIFWRIQNLEICKYQGFYIVHHVKYKIDLYYEHEILQFRYFASSKFWKLPKLSIFCTFVKYGIVFIVNLKYANIGHNAKYGICHHYQCQISKFPFFE